MLKLANTVWTGMNKSSKVYRQTQSLIESPNNNFKNGKKKPHFDSHLQDCQRVLIAFGCVNFLLVSTTNIFAFIYRAHIYSIWFNNNNFNLYT